ncbi:MAG: hypothetical protein RIF46_05525 [Cyclobacteriaceae bacterium]
MKNKSEDSVGTWVGILLGVIGVFAIVSIFEDDNSKIISKKGRRVLSDENRMKDINEEILKSENNDQFREVLI